MQRKRFKHSYLRHLKRQSQDLKMINKRFINGWNRKLEKVEVESEKKTLKDRNQWDENR